jgi:signal peptidase I
VSGEPKLPPSDDIRPSAPQSQSDAAGAPAVFAEPSVVAPSGRKSLVREYAEAIVVAMLLAFAIRVFVVQAFKIPSGSMIPTLLIGDHILVSKLAYGIQWPSQCKFSASFPPVNCYASQALIEFGKPQRGDIIVFRFPTSQQSRVGERGRARG